MNAIHTNLVPDEEELFARYIEQDEFPCLAAKTAVARGRVTFFHGSSIDLPHHDVALLEALKEFSRPMNEESPFRSFAVLFPDSPRKTPKEFEEALWRQLQRLHEIDARKAVWDESVDSDPASAEFSMSLCGHAFYVVGLHPGSSRLARRFPVTAMVFNLHRQFEQLREEKRYHRFSEAIIERDVALQGYANPMLAEHGSSSEARQYSGRAVSDDWICPFQPKG